MKKAALIRRQRVIDRGLKRLCRSHRGKALTCREISEGLGGLLTIQRIHQIEQEACRKLWCRLRREPEFEHLFQP
jgi:DNA-directed RNA polymerase sigma subunit (sigma70/sigma32)